MLALFRTLWTCYTASDASFFVCLNIMEHMARALGFEVPRTHVITRELDPSVVILLKVAELVPPEVLLGFACLGVIALVMCIGIPIVLAAQCMYLACLTMTCCRRRRSVRGELSERYISGLTRQVMPSLAANDVAALVADEFAFSPTHSEERERAVAPRRTRGRCT